MINNQQKKAKSQKLKINDIVYLINEDEKTASIFECFSLFDSLIIPRSINHKGNKYIITDILPKSFMKSSVKSIEFSQDSEVQIIHKKAFFHSDLNSIILPASVTRIGQKAFGRSFQKIEFPINSNLQTIEKEAFDDTTIEKVNFPPSLKTIGEKAFFFCSKLTEVTFPSNSELQTIEKDVFCNTKITSLMIPKSVTDLQPGWCVGMLSSLKIEVDPENKKYKKFGDKFIIGKSKIEQENYDVLVFCACDDEQVTIPSFIKTIGAFAFMTCEKLESVNFQKNSELETIEKGAFNCMKIKNFSIPKSVTDLKKRWAMGMTNVSQIDVDPENKKYKKFGDKFVIGKSTIDQDNYDVLVFCTCNDERITIPSFIKIIGSCAFQSCTSLKEVEFLPNSELQMIDDYAFSNSLIEKISIPSTVKRIGKCAFNSCSDLRTVEIPDNSELEIIDKYAFYMSAIESVFLPLHLTRVVESAFEFCNFLKTVQIPENSQLKVFEKCSFSQIFIETLFIPPKITKIEERSFSECEFLKTINIPENSELQTIEKDSFSWSAIETFTIPKSAINLMKGWCSYTTKLTNIFVHPENPRYKKYKDKFIIGKSEIGQENYDVLEFCVRNAVDATVPSFIKKIASSAFSECKSLKFIDFESNSELVEIEKNAMYRLSISSISFPDKLTNIEGDIFCDCFYLQIIEINNNLESNTNRLFDFRSNYKLVVMMPMKARKCFYL